MPDMLARSALAKFGVADTDVKLAAVGGDNDRYQALVGGVVEAAVVSNEYQPVAPKNMHLLVAGRDAVPNFLRVCMMSSAKKLAAKRRRCRQVPGRRDERACASRSHTGPKPWRSPARSSTPSPTIRARPSSMTMPSSITRSTRHCRCRRRRFAWIQEQMVKAGKLPAPLDLKTVTAPEYREKALELVNGHDAARRLGRRLEWVR